MKKWVFFLAVVMFGCAPSVAKQDKVNLNIYEIYKKYYPEMIVSESEENGMKKFIVKRTISATLKDYAVENYIRAFKNQCDYKSGVFVHGNNQDRASMEAYSNTMNQISSANNTTSNLMMAGGMSHFMAQEFAREAAIKAKIKTACIVDDKINFISERYKVDNYYYYGNKGYKSYTKVLVPN